MPVRPSLPIVTVLTLLLTACGDSPDPDGAAVSAPTPRDAAPTSNLFLWPELAPGETSESIGEFQPGKPGENPPITRIVNIKRPSLDVFLPKYPRGPAVLVIPGGGFAKVVTDKEGSEAAVWLNSLGIAGFVLRHRTSENKPADEPLWHRPLQDAERAMRLIRSNAARWGLDENRVGVLGFSAGGQIASVLMTQGNEARYPNIDQADAKPYRPDFALLIYPWRTLDAAGDALLPEIRIGPATPPTFIVHTHDDASSAVGSALIYAGLKKHGVPAELHIYQNGGHGYGMRPVEGSDIGTWPDRATDWLRNRDLAN
ncbi:MAG: alpha/beta hydrolase [Verrucomicrobiae bacterium]|nr:alpha/beta hydrolase [Verrucomicrobiae bacterium]